MPRAQNEIVYDEPKTEETEDVVEVDKKAVESKTVKE
jgi:hypothetical protein